MGLRAAPPLILGSTMNHNPTTGYLVGALTYLCEPVRLDRNVHTEKKKVLVLPMQLSLLSDTNRALLTLL